MDLNPKGFEVTVTLGYTTDRYDLRIEQIDLGWHCVNNVSRDFLRALILGLSAIYTNESSSFYLRIPNYFFFFQGSENSERICLSATYENGPNPNKLKVGPWKGVIGESFAYALRVVGAEVKTKRDNSRALRFPFDELDSLCQQLGGDFDLPLEEMPQSKIRSNRFDLLKSYCRDQNQDKLWANVNGWGWKETVGGEDGTAIPISVRYHPASGVVSIAEKHDSGWRRPYAIYTPDEESGAIAHLRSLR